VASKGKLTGDILIKLARKILNEHLTGQKSGLANILNVILETVKKDNVYILEKRNGHFVPIK